MPRNSITQRRYSGVNVLMLWSAMARPDFTTPEFATFRQIKLAGGMVRKGESGFKVYFVKPLESKTKKDSKGNPAKFFMLKEYTVFNIAQCDGLPIRATGAPVAPRNDSLRITEIEDFMISTGAEIRHGGDRAFYSPHYDSIVLPEFESFKGAADYYGVAIHELAHWTGAKTRLNREFGARFGDSKYAAEELVAELTSAFLSAEFGIDGTLQHAEYIGNWISLLKDDSRAFFTACSKAQGAADYLRNLALVDESSAEEDSAEAA
jgi:antirestriction protein ArdC